jgi:predicted nucleic acid-binding Zn ribbon protein
MGSSAPGPCPRCGGELRRVYGRVGVRFTGWGFRRTDSLVPGDRPRKDFKTLSRKAEEIRDS